MFDDILVAVPAYNEEKNIVQTVSKIKEKFKYVIVIDNCSTDLTFEKIKNLQIYKTRHLYNLGKSLSMKTALKFAEKKKFNYIAYIDADGQHETGDLIKICKMIKNKNLDAVIGFRQDLVKLDLKKRIGTILLEKIFSILYNKSVYDIQSGLRVLKTKVAKKIDWKSKNLTHYFADAEITCKLVKNKYNFTQIPIKTIKSEEYKGMNILQGICLIFFLLYWRIYRW
jgi:glycosyltransferase involved in cell wall biosynthesis